MKDLLESLIRRPDYERSYTDGKCVGMYFNEPVVIMSRSLYEQLLFNTATTETRNDLIGDFMDVRDKIVKTGEDK